jgi:hypothetical protein
MKVYYDSNGDGTPNTELTGIQDFPKITHVLDKPSICTIKVVDFESALYPTWKDYDFIKMSVEDDSSNQLFIGYLTSKKFTATAMILTVSGFGILLSWTPFNNNYTVEQGQIGPNAPPDGETLTVYKDANGNRDYDADPDEAFNWTADQFILNGQDKGLIVETPAGYDSELWKASALDDAGDFDNEYGVVANIRTYLSGTEYRARETTTGNGNTVEFTIDSTWDAGEDVIADTKNLKQFKIDYHFGMQQSLTVSGYTGFTLEIYNYDDAAWDDYAIKIIAQDWTNHNFRSDTDSIGGYDHITSPLNSYILTQSSTVTLSDYLDDDGGGNYDTIKLRLRLSSTANAEKNLYVDYLAVTIEYHSDDVGAVVLPITGNGTTTLISSGADFDNLGLAEDDGFKIGENTRVILDDIVTTAGLTLSREDTLSSSLTSGEYESDEDGTVTQWTSTEGTHYEAIADGSGDAKYISAAGAVKYDRFKFPSIQLHGGYVGSIRLHIRAKSVNEHGENLISEYSINGGTSWSSDNTSNLGAAWFDYNETWSGLEIYDLEDFKVRLTSPAFGGAGEVHVAEMWVEYFIIFYSDFDKYDARNFKGSFCMDALQKICKLEGAYWCEDHVNEVIRVIKADSFPDSTVNLTSADYGFDWEFDDKCNSVKDVQVYGSASLNVKATSTAGDSDSLIHRQIIDEGINSYGSAVKLAESEASLFATKKPSIKLSLIGVQTNLQVGTKVHITFERPTIAQAFYPIRMIERSKFGGNIMTVIWAGFGHTDYDEKIADAIIKASFQAHDAHQARLISTAIGAGASLTWGDIGGADTAVNALITTYNTTQHNRLITPSQIDCEQGYTAGANNVYWATNVRFGQNSLTNTNYCRIGFKMPPDYVSGEDFYVKLAWSCADTNNPNVTDYKILIYYIPDGAAATLINTYDSTWSGADANFYNHESVTIDGTNVSADDAIRVFLYMEDDDNNVLTYMHYINLLIPVNTRD